MSAFIRAEQAYFVIAELLEVLGEELPPWNDVHADIRTGIVKAIDAHLEFDKRLAFFKEYLNERGWESGLYSSEDKKFFLASSQEKSGAEVLWRAAMLYSEKQ